jgi:predicted RNA-binding Zn-ribbon protein involved in translation (DUF1610 family)
MKYTKLPSCIDMAHIIEAIEEDRMAGFCLACGCESENAVEPDAVEYKCDHCGERAIFGAEEILIMLGEF